MFWSILSFKNVKVSTSFVSVSEICHVTQNLGFWFQCRKCDPWRTWLKCKYKQFFINFYLMDHFHKNRLKNANLQVEYSIFSKLCFIKPLNQLLVNPMQNLITYLIYNTKSIQLPLQLTKYMLVRDRCHSRWKISWHLDVLGITNSQFLIYQPLTWTVRFLAENF